MSCGHWQSEYDASPCSYCEADKKAYEAKDKRIKELEERLETIASKQREACAQFIEQASLLEGRPVHAERCRAAPLVAQ